jgi:hypothetical protein
MPRTTEYLTENLIIGVCLFLILACLAFGMWLPKEPDSLTPSNNVIKIETCTSYGQAHAIPSEGQFENATGIYLEDGLALHRKVPRSG